MVEAAETELNRRRSTGGKNATGVKTTVGGRAATPSGRKLLRHNVDAATLRMQNAVICEAQNQSPHATQTRTAKQIREAFGSHYLVTLLGQTQSGKTGVISELVTMLVTEEYLPVANIYLLTGIGDVSLLKQWKNH